MIMNSVLTPSTFYWFNPKVICLLLASKIPFRKTLDDSFGRNLKNGVFLPIFVKFKNLRNTSIKSIEI